MTANTLSRSRGAFRPSFGRNFLALQSEGAGKTGCALHPRSRVQNFAKESAHEHTGSAETLRPSLRIGLRLIACSPVNGSFATVAGGIASASLTPAPRCQDHTPSPSASGAFVKGAIRVHRSPSRVDDVAQRPPLGRDGRSYARFAFLKNRNIFFIRG